jgi:hypothetical protein
MGRRRGFRRPYGTRFIRSRLTPALKRRAIVRRPPDALIILTVMRPSGALILLKDNHRGFLVFCLINFQNVVGAPGVTEGSRLLMVR